MANGVGTAQFENACPLCCSGELAFLTFKLSAILGVLPLSSESVHFAVVAFHFFDVKDSALKMADIGQREMSDCSLESAFSAQWVSLKQHVMVGDNLAGTNMQDVY